MDYNLRNKAAWNHEVTLENYWTRIIDEESIDEAKCGNPKITVTPSKPIPLRWIEGIKGKRVLNLGGGGGQQTPLLCASGADVVTVDISDKQLNQDRRALEKYNLKAELIECDMQALPFEDGSFDFVINPQSLNFIQDIEKVFKEVHRVLRHGGIYIFGLANPVLYIFNEKLQEKRLKVKYTLPFSSLTSLSQKELAKRAERKDTIEFSHTLELIIGGLLDSGFILEGFFSDRALSEPTDSFIFDSHLAFKARRI